MWKTGLEVWDEGLKKQVGGLTYCVDFYKDIAIYRLLFASLKFQSGYFATEWELSDVPTWKQRYQMNRYFICRGFNAVPRKPHSFE